MSKTMLIARREYLATVRRKGFIIATLLLPVFFVVIYGAAGGAAYLASRSVRSEKLVMGVVDESRLLRPELLDRVEAGDQGPVAPLEGLPPAVRDQAARRADRAVGKVILRSFPDRAGAKAAYLRKEVRGYYIIPPDFMTRGVVELETRPGGFMSSTNPGWDTLRKLIVASLVEGRIDSQTAVRVWLPAGLRSQSLDEKGQPDKRGQFAEVTNFAIPYAFALLFLLAIMSSAGYLMQGVSEEKENRVIEVLLSSAKPEQLLAGKIIGLGAAGLTQITVWVVMCAVPALQVLPFLDLRWDQLVTALVFFPLGFLLFGSLMGGTASLYNNFRESQQTTMIWSLSAVIPMFFMPAILAQPNGLLARILSYVPLTSPITVMLRIGATRVPWWDVTLAAVILIASQFLFIRLAAKLFRIGTLLYGKRPTIYEIVRWVKAA